MKLLHRPLASQRRYLGEYAAHRHAYSQVLMGLDGLLELELDGRRTYVDAASALVVPAGVWHAYVAQAPAAVLVIDTPAYEGLERFRRFVPPAHWKARREPLDAAAAVEEVVGASSLLARRRIDLAAIDAAIDADLHGAWSVERMAALAALSPQRFHARFVELTRMTPMAYLRRRRLLQAQRLLRAGFTLQAAAPRVGYSSASALAFALRRELGTSRVSRQ